MCVLLGVSWKLARPQVAAISAPTSPAGSAEPTPEPGSALRACAKNGSLPPSTLARKYRVYGVEGPPPFSSQGTTMCMRVPVRCNEGDTAEWVGAGAPTRGPRVLY